MIGEMKFEVWFESFKRSNTFQKSLKLLPKEKFFLGYYDSLKEIVDAFNKEDCVFENSSINSIQFATDALMNAITRLARTYASSYFPDFYAKAEEYNVIRIVDTLNNSKINSTKEVFITNGGIEKFEEFNNLCKRDEFANWKLAEIKNKNVDMLIWIPSEKNSIGAVVNMTITPYYAGVSQPLNITRKIGACTESIFSFKELQDIIFGKENKAPIITNKILLSKKRITELFLQGGFEIDEFPSKMSDYDIRFDLSFGNGSFKFKNTLASISVELNDKEWNHSTHLQINNGKIKKLILSNGVLEFIDLTEQDKEDLHKYYEWHGEEEDDNARK